MSREDHIIHTDTIKLLVRSAVHLSDSSGCDLNHAIDSITKDRFLEPEIAVIAKLMLIPDSDPYAWSRT